MEHKRHFTIKRLLGLLALVGTTGVMAQGWVSSQNAQVGSREQSAETSTEYVLTQSMRMGLAVDPLEINLGPWSPPKATPEGPLLIVGQSRSIAQTQSAGALSPLLKWQASVNGGSIAAISMISEAAEALRLGVLIDKLPGSAVFRLYTDHDRQAVFEISGQRVLQILQANIDAGDSGESGRIWWTPRSSGEQVTLEIELPAGTSTDSLKIAIPHLIHVYQDLSLPIENESDRKSGQDPTQPEPVGNALSCHLNSKCYDQYDSQRRGVARMTMVTSRSGNSYGYGLCTGTLLNDKNGTGTPYFITAAHCLSTQTQASSLETDWFFYSSSCGSGSLNSSTRHLYNGAQLLYSSAVPDVTFLRLNDAPPAGTMFLGWNSAPVANGTNVHGIHHPQGALQKISFGGVTSRTDCGSAMSGRFNCIGSSNGAYYKVVWSQGLTEPGSSGSPLFNGGQLTAVLSGGETQTCSISGGWSVYPSLNSVYPSLQKWLYSDTVTPPVTPPPVTQPPVVQPPVTQPPVVPTVPRVPVYRFFNVKNSSHFFTASVTERDNVIATNPAMQYENVAFYAYGSPQAGLKTVYRFYNKVNGAYFYTIDEAERDYVIYAYPIFQYEGPVWYASTANITNSTPVYRFFNTMSGTHFFTINAAERDFVIQTYPAFKYEGVGYNVWNKP